jgi:hypothetical protein
MRLDPFNVPLAPHWLGIAHYTLGHYPAVLGECALRAPNYGAVHLWLAATHARMGQRATSTRSRSVRSSGRDRKLKERTLRFARDRPQLSPVGLDDRPANRQSHPCSFGLCGVEGLENAIEMCRMDARPGITHCHENACVVLLRADQ